MIDVEILKGLPPVFILLFLIIIAVSLLGLAFKNEIKEAKENVEFLNNLFVDFEKKENENVFFVCHELKKMYYISLDEYDEKYTKIEDKYKLNFTPEGWGRHNIIHNGKKYNLYEV